MSKLVCNNPCDGRAVRGSNRLIVLAARRAVHRLAMHLDDGEIRIVEKGLERCFAGRTNTLNLCATITVYDPRFYRRILLGGSVGAGEAYMLGWWSCDDVATLVRILARNAQLYAGLDRGWARLATPYHKVLHWLRANTRRGSRENIAAHYDLGNDFFSLFLDRTMAYSAAIFPTQNSTLAAASEAKFERICRKLDLQPGDHLLEIGTGWGGFAVYAAQHYGCAVTTTTISAEQHAEATRRVDEAGLQDRVTLLMHDYRDLRGQFEKLVSIEMIEAVGWEYLPGYFQQCAALLKPEGRMVLQAITAPDHGYEQNKSAADFINRYIFPGGCLPSLTSMAQAVAATTDFRLLHFEDVSPHYALTLLRWREAFRAQLGTVCEMGFDEVFTRMWDFYLSLCAGAFAERRISSVQVVLAKPHCRPAPMNLEPIAHLHL